MVLREASKKIHNDTYIPEVTIKAVINAYLDIMREELVQGNDFVLKGIGKFVKTKRKGRRVVQTWNNKYIDIPDRRVVKFLQRQTLREDIQKYDSGLDT